MKNERTVQLSRLQIAYITSRKTITAEQQEALTEKQLFAVCDLLKKLLKA